MFYYGCWMKIKSSLLRIWVRKTCFSITVFGVLLGKIKSQEKGKILGRIRIVFPLSPQK